MPPAEAGTPRPLIHVGYHKTATSWMQALLFTDRHGWRPLATHQEIFDRVVRPHGLSFDPAPMRALMAERSAGLLRGHVPVLSSEILSGHPFRGGHGSDVYARRLKAIAPGARILISIRSQLKILPSVYMQYVQRGGTMPAAAFFDGTGIPGFFGFEPGHFDYDRLVGLYRDLFGAEAVHVLTQESLKTDMEGAVARLADFAGNTAFGGLAAEARRVHAASYPEYAAPVLRRINHVQASVLNPAPVLRLGTTPDGLSRAAGYLLRRPPVSTLMGDRRPVSDLVRGRFAGRFAESNARLAAMLGPGVDLSAYEGAQDPPAAAAR